MGKTRLERGVWYMRPSATHAAVTGDSFKKVWGSKGGSRAWRMWPMKRGDYLLGFSDGWEHYPIISLKPEHTLQRTPKGPLSPPQHTQLAGIPGADGWLCSMGPQ